MTKMCFTIDENGTANLFIMSRGRGGQTQLEDRDVLKALLHEFGMKGVSVGLEKAKELFRQSSGAKGGCKMLSKGDECTCFLCLCDNHIKQLNDLQAQ